MKNKKQCGQIAGLIIALVGVLIGGVIFMGAVSGWFDGPKAVLSEEYRCENCDGEFINLSADGYKDLINAKKSFVVFVDQDGCITANRVRENLTAYAKNKGIKVTRIMFADMKETPLYDKVKYYPSVAVVNGGNVIGWLKADADEDAPAYSEYDALSRWLDSYLR